MKTTLTLALEKDTPNKFVFSEVLDGSDPYAVKRIPALYLDKRDVRGLGFSSETPRFRVTLEAIKADS